ncbi:hypothetical protein BDZ89DRAFT_1076921 [Hymenopellis radicata]|nr:hypothetical protein BDZ89DRAFT_1076921 [Hymenopellis radicata]
MYRLSGPQVDTMPRVPIMGRLLDLNASLKSVFSDPYTRVGVRPPAYKAGQYCRLLTTLPFHGCLLRTTLLLYHRLSRCSTRVTGPAIHSSVYEEDEREP